MSSQEPRDTDEVDAHLEEAEAVEHLTQEWDADASIPQRLIDIHIYDLGSEEAAGARGGEEGIVESGAAAGTTEGFRRPGFPGRLLSRGRVMLCGLLGLTVLLVLGRLVWLLTAPTATITIIPVSVPVSVKSMVSIGSGTGQVPGRHLSALTMSQQQEVPTTGRQHHEAQVARGRITFYNAALLAQRVPAGTLLRAGNGVQVITEQEALIPAGSLATNGQVTVAARAVSSGPGGNLVAGAIYGPCCRLNVFAASGPFVSGQEARDEAVVSQRDLDEVAHRLTAMLLHSATAAMQAQVDPEETLLMPLDCTPRVSSDQKPGEQATMVLVRVSERCQGISYNTQGLHQMALEQVRQAARQQVGPGVRLLGDIAISVSLAGAGERSELMVNSRGMWSEELSEEQMQGLKAQVAGMSRAEATRSLLHVAGVQQVSISISQGEMLPAEPERITMLWLGAMGTLEQPGHEQVRKEGEGDVRE